MFYLLSVFKVKTRKLSINILFCESHYLIPGMFKQEHFFRSLEMQAVKGISLTLYNNTP